MTTCKLAAILGLLMMTGCAVKRPVVIVDVGTNPNRWIVHCPSDPRNDGAWYRQPSGKAAKEYCEFWHKWNHKTFVQRWRSSEQAYDHWAVKMCEKTHPVEGCDPSWKPEGATQ